MPRVDRPDERLVHGAAVAARCGRNTAIPGSSLTCHSACSPSPRYGGAGSRTGESCAMAPTQDALYAEIDLDLSWSERDLPERERTKHVHRLHPYLGKFIPQLVETLLERYVARGGHVLDPVRRLGHDARAGARVRLRRDGRRHRRVQLPAHARQDAALQPLRARARAARRRVATRRRDDDARSRRATCASGSRRRPRASCWRSASSSTSTSIATCCASSSRAPRGRRG